MPAPSGLKATTATRVRRGRIWTHMGSTQDCRQGFGCKRKCRKCLPLKDPAILAPPPHSLIANVAAPTDQSRSIYCSRDLLQAAEGMRAVRHHRGRHTKRRLGIRIQRFRTHEQGKKKEGSRGGETPKPGVSLPLHKQRDLPPAMKFKLIANCAESC